LQLKNPQKKRQIYAHGILGQMRLLSRRQFRDIVREPLKIRAQLGQSLFISILIGLIYLQISDGQTSIQDRLGSMFFILISNSLGAVTNLVTTFSEDKMVFYREHSNNMYRTSAYYLAKVFTDLPFGIFFPFLHSTIAYWMIGYKHNGGDYIVFCIAVILCANIGSCFGLIIGIIAKDVGSGTALVPIVIIPFMIFSGFFVNSNNVPDYFIWCQYVSFLSYAFSAVVYNELHGEVFTCNTDEQVPDVNNPGQFVCRIPDGETELGLLNFENTNVGENIGILIAMYSFYRILGFIILWYKARQTALA